jgi:hypothetical protein
MDAWTMPQPATVQKLVPENDLLSCDPLHSPKFFCHRMPHGLAGLRWVSRSRGLLCNALDRKNSQFGILIADLPCFQIGRRAVSRFGLFQVFEH